MQLVSFQIKECFGFRDSDRVDLQDPTNLIYILGRNSSGKTSFLTALEYFKPGLIPRDHPNFKNFNPSTSTPYLLSKYRVGEGDLSIDTFDRAFINKMQELNQGSPALLSSTEYHNLAEELKKRLHTLYTDLFERIIHPGSLWALRTALGNYQFSTEQVFKDYDERNKQVSALLTNAPGQLGIQVQSNGQMLIKGNWQPFHQMSFAEIENLVALQLPKIASFSKEYPLLDALPDIIKIEHLTQSPNTLTTALIEYLGKDRLEHLLKAENPRERDQLLAELREKITTLVDKVNRVNTASTELLSIYLDI